MNPAPKTAKAKVEKFWKDLVSSRPAPEPKTLPRQRMRALAYGIALRAVNKEFGTFNRKTGFTTYTISRKARHKIARAAARQALAKGRLHVAVKKEA